MHPSNLCSIHITRAAESSPFEIEGSGGQHTEHVQVRSKGAVAGWANNREAVERVHQGLGQNSGGCRRSNGRGLERIELDRSDSPDQIMIDNGNAVEGEDE